MTTPLGWLKHNRDIFDPPLPPRISSGIDAVSVGHLEKVSASVDSFGPRQPTFFAGLYYVPRCILGGSSIIYE